MLVVNFPFFSQYILVDIKILDLTQKSFDFLTISAGVFYAVLGVPRN